ncbi:hypothetical protein BGZ98_009847 [Dissophora globulifera]|nr:hypothetical protein BGZ98_009847 [Dissophora globulifera]
MLTTPLRRTALSRLAAHSYQFPTVTASATLVAARESPNRFAPVLRTFSTSFSAHQNQDRGKPAPSATPGLRQKNIPLPGANEDADSAISGFMNMFNDRESRTVSISVCTKHGFVTTEAITLQGPVLCIGGQVFLWDIFKESGAVVKSLRSTGGSEVKTPGTDGAASRSVFETMDEDTAREIFKVFELMNPRPEILIIGTGKAFVPLSPAVRAVIRGLGLQVDMMTTANAAATYNMLAEEGREVAAALLPLEPSTVQSV